MDVSKDGFELGGRPVGELVVACMPVCTGCVVLVDKVISEGEVAQARDKLLNVGDLSAVGGEVTKVVEGSGDHLSK